MIVALGGGTIAPWLLALLAILVLLTLTITAKAWRDAKRSPYFFMRRQAQQRMQSYSLAAIGLIVATLFTVAYASQSPPDTTSRIAVITKPIAATAASRTKSVDQDPTVVRISSSPAGVAAPVVAASLSAGDRQPGPPVAVGPATTPPEQYNRIEPTAELTDETNLTPLVFSQDVTARYEPVTPRRLFSQGSYTLYATFEYSGMVDGMAWSWVWRHNGELIDGGNQRWSHGSDGPGYVYLRPEEGFKAGEYTVIVWVNGQIMSQGSVTVSESAVSTSN